MSFLSTFVNFLVFQDAEMERQFWMQREIDFLYRQDEYFMYVKTMVETVILIDALKGGHAWNSPAILWSYLGLGLPLMHLFILWVLPQIYQRNRLLFVNSHKVIAAVAITQTGRLGRLAQPESTGNALMNLLEVSGILSLVAHSIGFVIPFQQQLRMQLLQFVWFTLNIKPICDKSMPTDVYNQIQQMMVKAVESFRSLAMTIARAISAPVKGRQIFVGNYYSCPALILTLQIVIGIFLMCALNFHLELISRMRYLTGWLEAQSYRSYDSRNHDMEDGVRQWQKRMKDIGLFQGGWGIVTLHYSIVASISTLMVWSIVSFIFLRR